MIASPLLPGYPEDQSMRISRFLLLARAQNKTASASGEALLPCLRELPHLAVPTDALGGKAFPAGAEAGFRAY